MARKTTNVCLSPASAFGGKDRFDEAQTLFDTVLPALTPDAKATLYYNHANT